jgi:RimJ/RimL family protein N-acetyltransferase
LKKGGAYSIFETRDGRLIILRPLRRSDLDAMVPFANNLVREKKNNREFGLTSMDTRVTRVDEKKFLDNTLEGMAKGRLVSVAAFYGSRLVGHCDIVGRTSRDERHAGVLGIVIIEGYRGVGLGERMIRMALSRASKIGVWMIELEVFAINTRAKNLYKKLGFETVGVIPRKVLRNGTFIDIVRMYIHLPHT